MTRVRAAALLSVVLLVGACAEDVVVGRYLTASADDGGADDSGTSDGGASDAGTVDAGATDAGATDAGTPDAGIADAGSLDAGATDAGTPDAGTPDGGSVDAGTDDGGPKDAGATDGGLADLALDPVFPWVLEVDGGATEFTVRVRNIGAADINTVIELTLVAGMAAIVKPGCIEDGGLLTCSLGVVPAGSSTTLVAPVTLDGGPRWFDVQAAVYGTSLETTQTNNKVTLHGVRTPSGTTPLAVPIGAPGLTNACFGTNITRYAQCVPGSRITEVLVFFADGGMSEADGGPPGFWAQGPTQRNLAFRFGFLGGMHLASFSGATDGGTCFEGVIDNVMSVPNSGAFQLCF